jgi:hypothetical protein
MFSMTIVFGPVPTPWTLLFKSEETFQTAMTLARTPAVASFERDNLTVADDFGQILDVKRSSVHGIMFEDMEQSRMAQIERGLHNTRTQIAAERAGQADPSISSYVRTRQQGPAVISPFNGAFRPQ